MYDIAFASMLSEQHLLAHIRPTAPLACGSGYFFAHSRHFSAIIRGFWHFEHNKGGSGMANKSTKPRNWKPIWDLVVHFHIDPILALPYTLDAVKFCPPTLASHVHPPCGVRLRLWGGEWGGKVHSQRRVPIMLLRMPLSWRHLTSRWIGLPLTGFDPLGRMRDAAGHFC